MRTSVPQARGEGPGSCPGATSHLYLAHSCQRTHGRGLGDSGALPEETCGGKSASPTKPQAASLQFLTESLSLFTNLPPTLPGRAGRLSCKDAAAPGQEAGQALPHQMPPVRPPVTVSKTARACPASVAPGPRPGSACLTAWREGRRPGPATRTLSPHTPTSPSGPAATTRGQSGKQEGRGRQRREGFSPQERGRVLAPSPVTAA